jgi:hypothetical protein
MAKYVAQKFVAPSPEAETMGYVLTIYLHNLRSEDIAPILEKHGISSIEPDQWYPMQRALDIQRDIYTSDENVSEKLVAAGIQYAQTNPFPPEIKTISDVLYILSQASGRASRNTPDGYGFTLKVMSEKHLWMFSNTPYDDDGVYGLLWGLANRFKPETDLFVVRIIDNPDPETYPGTCFDIKWGATQAEVE